jgi:hypothetical protein
VPERNIGPAISTLTNSKAGFQKGFYGRQAGWSTAVQAAIR